MASFEERFPNPNADADVARVRLVKAWAGEQTERIWNLPTVISHVEQFKDDPKRLDDYGRNVIGARLGHLHLSMKFRTYWLTDLYLRCVDDPNPFGLFFAARAQLELYSVCWEVSQALLHAAKSTEDVVTRMRELDEVLLKATWGTRDGHVLELLGDPGVSRVREPDAHDLDVLSARNVLTRLQKARGNNEYPTCLEDYEILSEFLHPNVGQQALVAGRTSVEDPSIIAFTRVDTSPRRLAKNITSKPMANAAELVRAHSNSWGSPFGSPDLGTYGPDGILRPLHPSTDKTALSEKAAKKANRRRMLR